jgi:hypothetical protein
MAHLYRLVLAALLAAFSLSAVASVPAVSGFKVKAYSVGSSTAGGSGAVYPGPSIAAACASAEAVAVGKLKAQFSNILPYASTGVSGNFCQVFGGVGGTQSAGYVDLTSVANGCPVNSTVSGAACSCTSPFVEDSTHTSCEAPPDVCASLAGKPAGSKTWTGTAGSYSFCDGYQQTGGGKCVVTADKDLSWEDPPGSGKWFSQGGGSYTGVSGGTCAGSGASGGDPAGSTVPGSDGKPPAVPTPGTAAPAPCATGMAPGTVNGTTSCYPIGPDTPTVAPSPQTGVKSVANADGTSTTSTTTGTTTCTNGKCTTTNTTTNVTKNAAGTVTNTTTTGDTTTQAQSSFCQSNGKSSQCSGLGDGSGGGFSGDCAAGFKADGDDPVLNAMAKEQYTRNCQILTLTSPEATVVANSSDATGLQKATTPNDSTVAIGSGNFDTSNSLGGGSCNLNKTITVAHMTATLPFNVICDPLAYLGQLLVAVSLLLAARIVARG